MTQPTTPQGTQSPINFAEALQIIQANLSIVRKVSGQNVILVLGQSQIGKSTTINALRGVEFKWQKVNFVPSLVPVNQPPGLQLAAMGNGSGTAVSEIPALYDFPPGFFLVDTCGLEPVTQNELRLLVSSILIEMICKEASSIRIVVAAEYAQLANLSLFRRVMHQIGGLLTSPSASIFWLFNKHPSGYMPSNPLGMEYLAGVMEEIQGLINLQYTTCQPLLSQQSVTAPGSKQLTPEDVKVIHSMNTALKASPCCVGYIDPTVQDSVADIRNRIRALPVIPRTQLKFDKSNEYRGIFDAGLEELLGQETPLLSDYPSFAVIEVCSISDFRNSLTAGRPPTAKSIQGQKDEIDSEVKRLRKEVVELRNREEIYQDVPFEDGPWLFKWFRISDVYYPEHNRDIQYKKWTVDLREHTQFKRVTNDGTFDIHLEFESDWFQWSRGTVHFWINSIERDSTRKVINSRENEIANQLKARDNIDTKSKVDAIDTAHTRILSEMNAARFHQIEELNNVVQALWKPQAGTPTGRPSVDNFLEALRKYREFKSGNHSLRPLQDADISQLAIKAAKWPKK